MLETEAPMKQLGCNNSSNFSAIFGNDQYIPTSIPRATMSNIVTASEQTCSQPGSSASGHRKDCTQTNVLVPRESLRVQHYDLQALKFFLELPPYFSHQPCSV